MTTKFYDMLFLSIWQISWPQRHRSHYYYTFIKMLLTFFHSSFCTLKPFSESWPWYIVFKLIFLANGGKKGDRRQRTSRVCCLWREILPTAVSDTTLLSYSCCLTDDVSLKSLSSDLLTACIFLSLFWKPLIL